MVVMKEQKGWECIGFYSEDEDENGVRLGIYETFQLANLAAGTWLQSQSSHANRVEIIKYYEDVVL
jgi:hypothetical protein